MNVRHVGAIGVLAVFGVMGAVAAGGIDELKLVERGWSDYRIVVGQDAAAPERYAADELQRWLEEMSGVELPIVTDGERLSSSEILIGMTRRLERFAPDLKLAELGAEGYVIRSVGPHLIIAGGSPRGTLYGVYGLLEDHLGCRWFTPEVSWIPKRKRVVLAALNEVVRPVLEYREPFTMDCFDGDWCARNRMNSTQGKFEERHGGHIRFGAGLFVHTFNVLMPPEKYFDEHPEYFSEVGGKRLKERPQLCCTNPDVVRLVTEEVLKRIEEDPEAFVYSVSQNDWDNHCECVNCRALADIEESQMAPVLQLVNQVAEAVAQKYPDKAVETLAYQWTRKAPKTLRPRPNVIIRLCSIECCFSHPLATCDSEENTRFRADAEGWSRVANRLWVWDYVTNFHEYMLPHPNFRVWNDNIQFFVKNNVRGIFEQDDYQSYNGEFSPLGGYMVAKFLWNPRYDEDTAMTEFLDGVYGKKAARYMRGYIDLLEDKVAVENIHMNIWESPQEVGYLTPDVMKKGRKLWDKAEKSVRKKPDLLERVQTARLSFDYAWIEQNKGGAFVFDHPHFRAATSPDYFKTVKRFFEVARRARVTRMDEGRRTLDQYEKELGVGEMTEMRDFLPANAVAIDAKPGIGFACYEGSWESLPDFSGLTSAETGVADVINLAAGKRTNDYGLVFNGYIKIPRDGVYGFYLSSNDGSRMTVAGEGLELDNDGLHGTVERSGLVALKAGYHPIGVWYFQTGGRQKLQVCWEGPGIEKEAVPKGALFH